MVEEVNKIIYNMLISGRGVYLPEVGTLFIERQGARKISDDKFIGPRNVVNFTSQEQAPSLVSEIVSVAGCSEEQASDIYKRWLQKTQEGAVVTIGGVGVLNHKSFSIESAFGAAINPKGVKTLVVRRRSNSWVYIVVAICVAIALGIFAYIMWGNPVVKPRTDNAQTEAAANVNIADTTIAADSTTVDSAAADANLEHGVEAGAESSAVVSQNTPASAANSASANVVSAANHSDYFAYYVVMGVFSTEANADRAVEQARKLIPNAVCAILPFKGDKFMVTVYGSDSQAECTEFARANRDAISDLWVYNKR